jgi:hypothetical protein
MVFQYSKCVSFVIYHAITDKKKVAIITLNFRYQRREHE